MFTEMVFGTMQLQIKHSGTTPEGKPLFAVVRASDSKHSEPVTLTPPVEVPTGAGDNNLKQDLPWYLEKFLELPIDTFRDRAEKVEQALSKWGKDCFNRLFGGGRARDWYQEARRQNLSDLRLKIASNDPAILSWPWEALESDDDGPLALHCRIERQLDNIADAHPLTNTLANDQLNILYIIARPLGDSDVGLQTLARPLIDFVSEGGWPAHIDVLRPPTFDQLREVLREKPNFYHIVHFDGHGGFGNFSDPAGRAGLRMTPDTFAAPTGVLVFEKDDLEHGEDHIPATTLANLLRQHNIPLMVLNACRSAMVDDEAEDPFASVASGLLKAGIRSVVAMSYNLWVSGARRFVPAFYRVLFQGGDAASAMRAGREEMYRHHLRDTSWGQATLHDWLVPVLYQQTDGFLPKLQAGDKRQSKLPDEARDCGDYGFIGRDRAIHQLERAIRSKAAGILIHGMAGEGKTTLAKGFLQWLEATNGLGRGVFWFSFQDIHSAGYIIDMLADALFGTQAMALPMEQKLAGLTETLREHPFFIVWDNFESASGIAGSEVPPLLSEDDRKLLKEFLHALRGGQSKVLITSRSPEKWLAWQGCYRLPLAGLQGEELWRYCNAVVADLGLTLDRESKAYQDLMVNLDGNPLAVRSILLRLTERPAAELLTELEDEFRGMESDEGTKRIQAALTVFERGLDKSFAPVLRLLGLHERYAFINLIALMLQQTGDTAAPIAPCFTTLESAGLCRATGNNIYSLHPALRDCLSRLHATSEADKRVFVNVMGLLADRTPNKPHEQRLAFTLFTANFRRALQLAAELDMREDVLTLIQTLANHALNAYNLSEAERRYQQLADAATKYGKANVEASAYHQLGRVAEERRDFVTAEDCFQQALHISLKTDDESSAAKTYHQLGLVAQERRDFAVAEDYYMQALDIFLKRKRQDEHSAAATYYQLGSLSYLQRDFDTVEKLCSQALIIFLKLGDEHGAAITYHRLGMVAEELRDLAAAEGRYQKALAIFLKLGYEQNEASSYHQLGTIAEERQDLATAEDWYKKSLEITLKLGDEHAATITYYHLGIVAQKRRDLDAAEGWYKQALAIELKLQNEHGMAGTYHQLGAVAQQRRDFASAKDCYHKSLTIKLKLGDEHGTAETYHQLGTVAAEQQDFAKAEDLLQQALEIFTRQNDPHSVGIVKDSLALLDDLRKRENS